MPMVECGLLRGHRGALLACLTVGLLSCSSGTVELSVDLRTDLVPGAEFDIAEVQLSRVDFEGVDGPMRAPMIAKGAPISEGVRIADFAGLSRGTWFLTVTLRTRDGAEVVSRPVQLDLRGDFAVTVLITRSCRGVMCPLAADDPSLTACLGGQCVDPRCSFETPEFCPADQCTLAADCAAPASCAMSACNQGVCLAEETPGVCGGGEFCEPETGCRALPGEPVDAGPADGGMSDAGLDAADADADAGPTCTVDGTDCAPGAALTLDGIAFRFIPAGSFTRGAPAGEPGAAANEQPEHMVTLTEAFWLGELELLQGRWRAVMGNNPSSGPADLEPVNTVEWNEALAFCNALSTAAGLTPCYDLSGCTLGSAPGAVGAYQCAARPTWDLGCDGYRLPTDAEWEYAARAGTTTAFYNGDITVAMGTDPNLELIGWYQANASGASEGGLLAPNAWGLRDTSGNISEWCWDWLANYAGGPEVDPMGPATGTDNVLRGGSRFSEPRDCRSAARGGWTWNVTGGVNQGFRVARSAR